MKAGILNTINKADITVETDIRINGTTTPIFQLADTLSADYSELTDSVDLDKFRSLFRRDYKFVRSLIKGRLFIMAGADLSLWSTTALNDAQRKVFSKFFLVPKSLRDTVHTLAEQKEYGYYFHIYSKSSRESRCNEVIKHLLNDLTPNDADIVISDVYSLPPLFPLYTEFGREGTLEGDTQPYLFDYLEARINTVFVSYGLKAKTFTTQTGITINDLVIKVMDIFKNGNYEYFGFP